ncbi:MAG: type II toxin-antitoxin system HicB family antitoxin [Candidatus Anammoximicrobium sp.]|nr:type II toxin-antitoxin system HicB family antitoxin [Candidatus Anammoximicrobium sp.]
MRFVVTIDRDADRVWVVECPPIRACVSQGSTRPESLSLDNLKDAIAACSAVRSERGMPLTVEIRKVEVVA